MNLAFPLEEALMIGPVPFWLIVRPDWPLEVAKIANKPSTSTAPAAEVMLLLIDVLTSGLSRAILPVPSGARVILELLPALVVSTKGCPETVNWPPVAWNVGLAVPPMLKFPFESKANTTLFVPAPDWVIGGKPWSVSEFAA